MVFGGEGRGRSVVANRVYRGDYIKLTANLLPVKKGGFVTVKKGEVHNGITEHNGEIRLISL